MSAKNSAGAIMGQEVLKLSPEGKVLMTLGKEGVGGTGPDMFDRPTGVAIAPNGDIFVSDGHYPNKHDSARVVKFSKDGRFIKSWGQKGGEPGEFDEPHDIFVGGSQERVYVADRRNRRIQVFDQDGKFIAAWKQFGQPSSVFVGKDDTIYVGASFPDPNAKKGELRGIVIGNAKDGALKAFIPDPSDLDQVIMGTSASGIAADDKGTIYAADVGTHNLRKYVKANRWRRPGTDGVRNLMPLETRDRVAEEQSGAADRPAAIRNLCVAFVALGAGLRLWQYFAKTAMWIDEIAVARNILDRSLWKLLTLPLAYDQAAPKG